MSNHHLKNEKLSLKAKGLLSQMLSPPKNWDYSFPYYTCHFQHILFSFVFIDFITNERILLNRIAEKAPERNNTHQKASSFCGVSSMS